MKKEEVVMKMTTKIQREREHVIIVTSKRTRPLSHEP
jgi:hypothetical protein